MCAFCEIDPESGIANEMINNFTLDCGILGKLEVGGILYEKDGKEKFNMQLSFNTADASGYDTDFKFCPMCGRKLKGA